jgi:hypothetical protein
LASRATHPYIFGSRYRDAIRQVSTPLPASADALIDTIGLIAAYPSLHDALVERLVQIDAPAAVRQQAAAALEQHQGWDACHRWEIGLWLDSAGVAAAKDWLADLSAYPQTAEIPLPWRIRSWGAHGGLPAVLFLTPEELRSNAVALPDAEEYFLAHRAFAAHSGSRDAALRLLRAAMRIGAESVIAALFDSGALAAAADDPAVVTAFHAFPWSERGALKQRYCLSIVNPSDARLRALALWARGRHVDALQIHAGILDPSDPVMMREYAIIGVSAGTAVDAAMLEVLSGYAKEWLLRLTTRMSRTHRSLSELVAMPLPPPDDPLFALAVSFTHRQLARAMNTGALMADFASRASDADPAWLRHVPHVEREYASIWPTIRSHESAALGASALERLLLLPVELDWLSAILRSVQEFPPEWFTSDDFPTPMSDMVIASCIRIVEQLAANGHVPDEEQQRWLCSGSVASVLQTTLNLLDEEGGRS